MHDLIGNSHRYRRMQLLLGTAGMALCVGAPAFAQAAEEPAGGLEAARTAAPDESSAAIDSQGAAPQAIIVTAQKRAEALEEVPISIAAVSAQQLTESGVTEVVGLSQTVPALRINYAGTFVLPTIRGVGSVVALPGLVQNIATYVDGYYIPTPSASNLELINVESVNVLKGPQGTLFGANATGGAISVTTLTPQEDPSALIRLSYGSYNNLKAQGYVTGGLADGLAADLAASYEYGDGYITNVVDNDDNVGRFRKYSVRPKLRWEATDDITFTLGYEHSYSDDPITQLLVPRDGATVGRGDPSAIIVFDQRKKIAHDQVGFARRKVDAYTLTSEFDFDFATLTSYTGYRKDRISQGMDYDSTSAAINFSDWNVNDKTFTQEFNLASNDNGGPLSWVVGAFYMKYKDQYDFNVNGSDIFVSQNETTSYAAFADVTYEIIDNLFLTGGVRYTRDKPEVAYDLIGVRQDSGDVTFEDVAFRAVARYELSPGSNIYASFSQGYRSGGLPGSAFDANTPVEPEYIDAFEVGYKTGGYGPLRASIAAFY